MDRSVCLGSGWGRSARPDGEEAGEPSLEACYDYYELDSRGINANEEEETVVFPCGSYLPVGEVTTTWSAGLTKVVDNCI
jgi:hypothetical protein